MLTEKILTNKYTPFIIVLLIFPIYLINVMPVHSWASAGVDHFDFIYAAKYQLVPHSTGFPLYIIPANLVLGITDSHFLNNTLGFGEIHPAWALALFLSTIPALINLLLVFYITKELSHEQFTLRLNGSTYSEHNKNWEKKVYAPYIALFGLAGAGLVLAQAFIVEVYTFSTMFALITILFHVKKKYNWSSVFMGLTLGTHGLMLSMMFLLGLWHFKIYIKRLPIILIFGFLPYLYLPWAMSHTPEIEYTTLTGTGIKDYIAFLRMGSSISWWGSLPIWEFPIRVWDTIVLLATGIGLTTLSLFLSIRYDWKKYLWIWFIIGTTLYYWLTVTVKIVHVHFALIIPLLVVLAALGIKHSKIHPRYYIAVSLVLILVIPFYWDIGRVVDKPLSAENYIEFLNSLPDDNHIILNMSLIDENYKNDGKLNDGTAIWWAVLAFNRENNRNLISIYPDRYVSHITFGNHKDLSNWYRATLQTQGINTPEAGFRRDELLSTDSKTVWYIIRNGKKIIIPDTAYDPCINKELTELEVNFVCLYGARSIYNFQLWYVADLLQQSNPDKTVHLVNRIGQKNREYVNLVYSRDLLPSSFREALEQIDREVFVSANGPL